MPVRALAWLLLLLAVGCGESKKAPVGSDGSDAVDLELVRARLTHGDGARRLEAARLLAARPDLAAEALDDLTRAVEDENRWVREWAIRALEPLGERAAPAVEALTRALTDRDSFVRWRAAKTLARIGPAARSALPRLEEAAASEDETELGRYWAKEAVRAIREP